ncbi:F-box protein SKIP2-like [Bidens hawaiensis]|uniref:F-box protein SKIP2-like n=1 Tax=Bidens hawaiensis TaxID=980011 RepID=UPI00404B4AFB
MTPTISDLPDACLARVFHFLSPTERNRCSLVCRYWLIIEGQSRHRLSLNAQSDLNSVVKSIFSRFDAVTKLSLKCDRRSSSINDEELILISQFCQNLIRIKLRSCRKLTDSGIESFTNNCNKLKKISFGSCNFGAKGMNAVIANCQFLEELSVKRLIGDLTDEIKPGVAAASLKMISLKDLYNGQRFEPLIIGCKKLKTLSIVRCYGDYDKFLESVGDNVCGLVEIHLERLQVSDLGLEAVSKCRNLQILHLLKTPDCSDLGVMYVAEGCRLLRKIHIDGWKTKRIGDEGLISVAKNCVNLQELVLISVDVTCYGLEVLSDKCRKLERLALCGSDAVGDGEIVCIAAKCVALRKLCIKSCNVSDYGIGALAVGCPNLVKVKVKKCKGVSSDGVGWLMANREPLMVSLDKWECW